MCEYCDIKQNEYTGNTFNLCKNLDGGRQDFEIYIADSPEVESYIIVVSGVYTALEFEIRYCPACGKKL